jgi:hypothetical protein
MNGGFYRTDNSNDHFPNRRDGSNINSEFIDIMSNKQMTSSQRGRIRVIAGYITDAIISVINKIFGPSKDAQKTK